MNELRVREERYSELLALVEDCSLSVEENDEDGAQRTLNKLASDLRLMIRDVVAAQLRRTRQ